MQGQKNTQCATAASTSISKNFTVSRWFLESTIGVLHMAKSLPHEFRRNANITDSAIGRCAPVRVPPEFGGELLRQSRMSLPDSF
jgi:hypothetical protein